MACNCLCCGCQNCTEGQEGKCCCGGPSGECCQPGEYCCSGACQEEPCSGCPGGGPGLGTLNPDFCGGYDSCCTEEGCVPATYFLADVSDCVCYSDEGQTPGDPGVYATYADCCDENFCPDPPP